MAMVIEVEAGIYRIVPEGLDRGILCECYLIVDDQIALIETGATSQVDQIIEGMAKLGYEPTSLSYIIPTHIHADHGGGAGYLAGYAPDAKVIVHEQGARHLIDPSRLILGTRQTFGDDFEDEFGPLIPVPEHKIFSVQGGETISLGKRDLKIIHTPGHAPHHICIYETKSHGLFCGEALGCYMPEYDRLVLATAPPLFEINLALESNQRLKDLDPRVLFFSQWGVSRDARRLIELSEEYIKACRDIILSGTKEGETEESIIERLGPYVWKPDMLGEYAKSESILRTFGTFLVGPYVAYFKREGLT